MQALDRRPAVRIQPLRRHVYVTLHPETTQTASGLHLSETAQHLRWATVQSVGDEAQATPGSEVLVNTLLGHEVHEGLVVPDQAIVATR